MGPPYSASEDSRYLVRNSHMREDLRSPPGIIIVPTISIANKDLCTAFLFFFFFFSLF